MEQIEISSIPLEIIEEILGKEELTFIDVWNFGRTCTLFSQLVNRSNQIWKAKFKQMWPQLAEHEGYKRYPVTSWLKESRQRWLIGRRTMQLVNAMSANYIKQEELSFSDFNRFEEIFTKSNHKLALSFMIDELMRCIHHENRNTNLTNKYYSEKTLRHLRQVDITQRWEEFKNAPSEEQILEHGAVIIAQWSQPTLEITNESIGSELNTIAEDVRKFLLSEHGDKNPALRVSSELRNHWQTHNIPDNYYSGHVCRQVMQAVSTVLFQEMGFYGNSELYYSSENSYINKVLEHRRGIPITLSIVYESICRRLGVKCEPVSFPGHFLLRWRDTYKENVLAQYYYIDVFNGGVFLSKNSCPSFSYTQGRCPMSDILRFGPATAIEVVERMANNLEMAGRQRTSLNGRAARLRSALELMLLVNPSNFNCMMQLARFYMQSQMDVSALLRAIKTETNYQPGPGGDYCHLDQVIYTLSTYNVNYLRQLRELTEVVEVKKRAGLEVQFAVGMVMHHRQYNYTCVVIGWDPICAASEEWINQMNVKSLSRQHNQPFYHVLVNDGTNRYAAEENLEMERVQDYWVPHSDVGRYFNEFHHNHYQANSELLWSYPDDALFLRKRLALE